MSLERLQTSYSADERRAIHDAVVNAVPFCHDLTDLALLSGGDEKSSKVILSRQEILAELRNMRRRRTKYRVAAKSRNYSDVLRDVIKTQMEHYNDGKSEAELKQPMDRDNSQRDKHDDRRHSRQMSKDNEKDRYRYDGKIVPRPIQIKTEREDSTERNYRDSQRDYGRDRSDRYEKGSRDKRDRANDRHEHYDRSRERRNYEDVDKTQKYGEHSRKRRYDDERREKLCYYEDSNKREDGERHKEHRTDKRSRKDHRHTDYNPKHQVKIEPGLEEVSNNQGETSRHRRNDEKRDKTQKHKDKKERRRDRERSREKRRDNRCEERPSERIHIKQEREHSVTRDDRKRKNKSRRHDRSHRDEHYDNHGLENGRASEEIYDPNKKIKEEK